MEGWVEGAGLGAEQGAAESLAGHITEGFIVICNYVVFCGALARCSPTLRLFLAGD